MAYVLLASSVAIAPDSLRRRTDHEDRLDMTYYVDPAKGDDNNAGTKADQAWRTLKPVNARLFAPGDHVEFLGSGSFIETLNPMGAGTPEKPIEIRFAPGEYDFHPDDALKRKLHISNTNGAPNTPKAIAILLQNVRHLKLTGTPKQTNLFVHGKMIELMCDRAENVTLDGLAFDYRRPLVSEFTILDVADRYADVQIQKDCTYAIEKDKFVWVGEGWRSAGTGLNQEYDPADDGKTWRRGSGPLNGVTRTEELEPFKLRFHFEKNPGFTKGRVIQFRETFRDCSAGLIQNSKDIVLRNGAFHALGGMGIIHQFTENITYERMEVAPRAGSGRTTCGWADMLHFSGCKGQILVDTVRFSGSHDDPINVHGTYLRIVSKPGEHQILVRFMHGQTYGFQAFFPGDEIEFVNHVNLCSYATAKVAAVEMESEREILLTLEQPVPAWKENDVVENVTWTPSVTIQNCHVSADSCRGFLLSTRRPVLVEKNTFLKTTMSAIDISADASSWFESGPVRDVTIRNNRFIKCGEPVIRIMPESHTARPEEPVHQNIRIVENVFDLSGNNAVSAKLTKGLIITGNRFSSKTLPIQQSACTDVVIDKNTLEAKE